MTAEQKVIWITELRSGKWKQGHGHLERNGTYCCLGVAQKLFNVSAHTSKAVFPFFLNDDFLPNSVQYELANRNDRAAGHTEHTFPQIADYIETSVEPTE